MAATKTKSKLMKVSSFKEVGFAPKIESFKDEIERIKGRVARLGDDPIVRLVKSLDKLLKVVIDQNNLCDSCFNQTDREKMGKATRKMLTDFTITYKKSMKYINRYI